MNWQISDSFKKVVFSRFNVGGSFHDLKLEFPNNGKNLFGITE